VSPRVSTIIVRSNISLSRNTLLALAICVYVSTLSTLLEHAQLKMASTARIYVSYKLISMFLRPYAFQRSKANHIACCVY